MKIALYQVDAFTTTLFGGNPACVVPLDKWLPDELLLKIANENAVSETAFFTAAGNSFHLRWFTPEIEMDLCGHATLATAHILKTMLGYTGDTLKFDTASGRLSVTPDNGKYILDFPSRPPVPAELPDAIGQALNHQPTHVLKARDYMLVYDSEQAIRTISIDKSIFDTVNLDPGGVIITAQGTSCDFVSRYFTPQSSILEDPVTGSAHCSLIPYWSKRLGKKTLVARQLSKRQGELFCTNNNDRVLIGGKAVVYSTGYIYI